MRFGAVGASTITALASASLSDAHGAVAAVSALESGSALLSSCAIMNWVTEASTARPDRPEPLQRRLARRTVGACVLQACSLVATAVVLLRAQLLLPRQRGLFTWPPWVAFLMTLCVWVTWEPVAGSRASSFVLAGSSGARLTCHIREEG